jgi:hypothetical protein
MAESSFAQTQEERILNALRAAWPGEVSAVVLSRISLQFCARIFSRGLSISNRLVRQHDGTKHSFYKLGPRPVPWSKELREAPSGDPVPTISSSGRPDLLFDLPGREHRDDG